MMCNPCFELALMVDNDERPTSDMPLVIHNAEQQYMTSIEDYSHKPYFTREAAIKIDSETAIVGQRLTSYEPQPNQLFSLAFESTYFDIPGRAPRWATHSGTDYHGKSISVGRSIVSINVAYCYRNMAPSDSSSVRLETQNVILNSHVYKSDLKAYN